MDVLFPLIVPLIAQTEIPSASIFEHFVKAGGWITWFILIPLSMATVALVIHYLITIRRKTQMPPRLAETLVGAAGRGDLHRIIQLTNQDDTMLAQAAMAGISQVPSGREAARSAIDEVVEERSTRLFRRIEYLNVIGSVSPMIGLLGTVLGMINAFSRIFAAGGGMPDAGQLAGDIAVALVTTFWGILVAIPAMTAFALFRNRVDAFAAECVKLCDGLASLALDAAAKQGRPPEPVSPPAPSPPPQTKGTRSTGSPSKSGPAGPSVKTG